MAEKMNLEQSYNAINDIASKIGILNDRMRLVEERGHQNRDKIRIIDENIIVKFKDLKDDVRRLNIEVDELRRNLDGVVKSLQRMIKDLGNTAKLSDVLVIDKVMELFDPTRYLTEKDVIRLIEERGLR